MQTKFKFNIFWKWSFTTMARRPCEQIRKNSFIYLSLFKFSCAAEVQPVEARLVRAKETWSCWLQRVLQKLLMIFPGDGLKSVVNLGSFWVVTGLELRKK